MEKGNRQRAERNRTLQIIPAETEQLRSTLLKPEGIRRGESVLNRIVHADLRLGCPGEGAPAFEELLELPVLQFHYFIIVFPSEVFPIYGPHGAQQHAAEGGGNIVAGVVLDEGADADVVVFCPVFADGGVLLHP